MGESVTLQSSTYVVCKTYSQLCFVYVDTMQPLTTIYCYRIGEKLVRFLIWQFGGLEENRQIKFGWLYWVTGCCTVPAYSQRMRCEEFLTLLSGKEIRVCNKSTRRAGGSKPQPYMLQGSLLPKASQMRGHLNVCH